MNRLTDILRAFPLLAVALAAAALMALADPANAGLLVWGLAKVTLAAWLGYWIARSMDRGRRPHELPEGPVRDAALLRRNLLVAASMIAFGLLL